MTNSKTVRDSVTLKIVKRKGQVTYFLADTSEEFIDVAAFEMEQHLQAHVIDLIYYILYGNKGSEAYIATTRTANSGIEFDGLSKMIATNRFNNMGVPTDLSFMDTMIDASNRKGGARHVRAFGMSPEMLSKVSRLLTNVRLNQDYGTGLTQIDVNGGLKTLSALNCVNSGKPRNGNPERSFNKIIDFVKERVETILNGVGRKLMAVEAHNALCGAMI